MNEPISKKQLALIFGILAIAFAVPPQVLADPSVHEGISCVKCHGTIGSESASQTTATIEQCQQCHSTPGKSEGRFHRAAQDRCLQCHSFHKPAQIETTVGNVKMDVSMDQDFRHCQGCHDDRGTLGSLSPGHLTAAGFYHLEAEQLKSVNPTEACLRCHANNSESPWKLATDEDILFVNTHASHPIGIKVIPGKGSSTNWIAPKIDDRISLFDGKMECQTCHLLSAGNEHLMVPFESKYELCRGCHKHAGDEEENTEKNYRVVLGSR